MTTTRYPGPTAAQWLDRSLLTDSSRCPACATPLAGPGCGACGLPLEGPAAGALWESSRRAADLLERRDGLIMTLRRTGAARPAEAPVVATAPVPVRAPDPFRAPGHVPPPVQVLARPVVQPPVAAAPPGARPSSLRPPVPHPGPAVPQSWPLQNVLLGLGALLLAGASIVFLAFTWGQMPLPLRATVIAVVTAAVLGSAAVAARKGLRSSADAIAALGSLLVLLDAWALHATGLVAQPDGPSFGALAALGAALVLMVLGTALRLDVPRAVGCVLLPAAPLLLSLDAPSPSAGTLLVLVAAATCGLHATRFCERRVVPVLRVLALVLVVLAVATSLVVLLVDGALAAAGILLVTAVLCAAWTLLAPASGHAWPVVAGITLTLAVLCAAIALSDVSGATALWLGPLGALLGVASVMLAVRGLPRLPQVMTTAAWWTFLAATVAPVLTAVSLLLLVVTTGLPAWEERSVLGAALCGLVVALAGALGRETLRGARPASAPAPLTPVAPVGPWVPHGRASRPPAGPFAPAPFLAGLLLIAACLLVPWTALTVALWLVVPLALVAASAARLPATWRTASRATCITSVTLATVLSAVLGAGADTAAVTATEGRLLLAASLLVGMVTLLLARTWTMVPPPAVQAAQRRAGLLLAALVVGAAGTGTALSAVTAQDLAASPGAALPLLLLTLGLVLVTDRADRTHASAASTGHDASRRALPVADVRAVLSATAIVVAVALVAAAVTPGGWLVPGAASDAPAGWVSALVLATTALAAVVAAQVALGGGPTIRSSTPPGALVACAAAAPVLAVLAVLAVRPLVVGRPVVWELLVIAIVGFFPVLAAVRAAVPPLRAAMETSATTLAAVSVLVVAADRSPEDLTVALVLCAGATVAWAAMPGRARAAWFAFALAVAASWNALATGGIGVVEAYTAPGAAVLAGVGAWRASRGARNGQHQLLAGTALLLLPTALLAPASEPWRSLVLVGGILLLSAGATVAGRRHPAGGAGRSSRSSLAVQLLALCLTAAVLGVVGRATALASAWTTVHADADGARVTGTSSRVVEAERLLAGSTADVGVWVALGALCVGALCWLLARAWLWSPTSGPRTWGAGLTALATTVPLAVLVAGGGLSGTAATGIVLGLLGVWGATAVLGMPPGEPRVTSRSELLGRALPPLGASYVVALGLGGQTEAPMDVLLTVVGVVAAVVAVRAAVLESGVTTWGTAGLGTLASLAPLTAAMLVDPQPWRVVAGVLGAAGWLLAGLRLRWQAPVAIGGGALVLQVLVLAGPPALASLAGIPGWVVLAATGLVLLGLGLTYERQVTTARATLRRFAELR